ncbi:MAG: hypothetical protein ACOVMM_13025 [Chitinophagaceae bacterium]
MNNTPNNFYNLTQDLLLRISINETNEKTKEFLKKHIPTIASEKVENGTWTAFPPIEFTNEPVYTKHSIQFNKHPFIDIHCKNLELVVHVVEKGNGYFNYETFYTVFNYDNLESAQLNFDRLCAMFDKVSTKNKTTERGILKAISYISEDSLYSPNEVQILLTKNEIFDSAYKIYFGQIIHEHFYDFYFNN